MFYGLGAIAGAGISEVGVVVGETGPAIEAAVRGLTPSGRGELEITEGLQWLIDAVTR